jgi:hypothetical protein
MLLRLTSQAFIGKAVRSSSGFQRIMRRDKDKIRDGSQQTKLMIVWNPNGFGIIDAIPKGETHNAQYYTDNLLTPICQRLIPAGKLKLVIHADNSRCQPANVVLDFISQSKVRFAPHLPYSPDIASPDFFLFGY